MAGPVTGGRLGYAGAFLAGAGFTLLLGASDPYAGLDVFARVLSDVDAHYQSELPPLDIVHAALEGIPAVLDEHSDYFPPEEWSRIRQGEAGVAVGIGVTVAVEPCGLRVAEVEPWGPAERAGVAVGDCLAGVDEAGLVGTPSTTVRFTLVRGESRSEKVILRGKAAPPAVVVEPLGSRLWYARVRHFGDDVDGPLAAAIPVRPPAKGLLLDLRDNLGGSVEEAAELVDRFVQAGVIVSTQARGEAEAVVHATSAPSDWGFPVVVLVNGQSASAAEIVAGSLQDLKRARLFGTHTWGKGSVLRYFQYEDGSALKLTVGSYRLPSGRGVPAHVGLLPDVVVEAAAAPVDPRAPMSIRLRDDPQLAAGAAALQSTISQPDR